MPMIPLTTIHSQLSNRSLLDMYSELSNEHSYMLSHLGILKLISIWGLIEALIYWITGGEKCKEILIHACLFITITIIAFYYPHLSNDLK